MEDNWTGFDEKDGKQGNSRKTLPLVLAGLVVLLIFGFVYFRLDHFQFLGGGRLSFIVKYDAIQELTAGSPVVLNSYKIGEVKKIEYLEDSSIGVQVEVYSDYKDFVFRNSTFLVVEDAVLDPNDRDYPRMILIEYWGESRDPIQNGDVFEGPSSMFDYYMQLLTILGKDAIEQFASVGDLTVSTTVNANLSIDQYLRLESGKWIPQKLLFNGILPNTNGWVLETPKGIGQAEEAQTFINEDKNQLISSGSFENYSDSVWGNSDLLIEKTNKVFWTEYKFQQRFEPEDFQTTIEMNQEISVEDYTSFAIDLAACIAEPTRCKRIVDEAPVILLSILEYQLGNLSSLPLGYVQVSLNVSMPGKIYETNSNIWKGGTASWGLTGADINKGVILTAKSWRLNVFPILFGLVIIAGSGICLYRRKQTQKDISVF